MALSQELQPLGPTVFSGPLQPPTQFSWQGLHSPSSSYLPSGHSLTQKGPSLVCLQAWQESAPGPSQVNSHSEWHFWHSFFEAWKRPRLGSHEATHSLSTE